MEREILEELRQNPQDLVVLASWFYKIGDPIIDDFEFNALEESVGSMNIVWDELVEPVEIMKKYNIEPSGIVYNTVASNPYYNQYMDSLYDAGTKSIRAQYTFQDIYDKMMYIKGVCGEINISLKVDGVSTRNIIEMEDDETWNLKASLSRSRESRGFDYTSGMQLAVKKNLTFRSDAGMIHEASGKRVMFAFGEAYVERTALAMLREKYGKQDTWKTPRSTALSMLLNLISPEDYKYLKFRCFKLDVGSTLSEMFEESAKAGLDVVPYIVISTEEIPEDYMSWEIWFKAILTTFENIMIDKDIEADGIVVAVNDLNSFNNLGATTGDKYNVGMFSCKVGPWGSSEYESEVVDIIFDNSENTSEYSVVAVVKPVVVSTGNTVTRVNCFNPKILIENKIVKGSHIRFEYKSASSIVLKYEKNI